MTTIGYLFIFIAAMALRGLTKGRTIDQTPTDLGDALVALLSGNMAGFKAVLARTGTGFTADASTAPAGTDGPVAGTAFGGGILAEAQRLGSAAKGYRTGGTGPTYYDCSGLVWRALKNLGLYNGPRFTTYTFTKQVPVTQLSQATATVGDIVLWTTFPAHHIGIVSQAPAGKGATRFYSARNPRSGIAESAIDGFEGKIQPTFWRIKGAPNQTVKSGQLTSAS